MQRPFDRAREQESLLHALASQWAGEVTVSADTEKRSVKIECGRGKLQEVCGWLFSEAKYTLATLVVQDNASDWLLRYIFYGDLGSGQVHVLVHLPKADTIIPSISARVHAADWHEREVEDLFGLTFQGHPRLGDFVLHEEWPEGVNPMRSDFDASKPYPHREIDPEWKPLQVFQAPGAFMMPIGPIYSDYAESAQFFLETVGEDVIRTTPRFFYKYRGMEKLAEGQPIAQVLLMAERFSGTSACAHSLAFCQAVERICGVQPPARGQALRVLFAELERVRHHVGAIGGICGSTALAVAASQASILEEETSAAHMRDCGAPIFVRHQHSGWRVAGFEYREVPSSERVNHTCRGNLKGFAGNAAFFQQLSRSYRGSGYRGERKRGCLWNGRADREGFWRVARLAKGIALRVLPH